MMAKMHGIKCIYMLQMTKKWTSYVIEYTDGTSKRFTIENEEEK